MVHRRVDRALFPKLTLPRQPLIQVNPRSEFIPQVPFGERPHCRPQPACRPLAHKHICEACPGAPCVLPVSLGHPGLPSSGGQRSSKSLSLSPSHRGQHTGDGQNTCPAHMVPSPRAASRLARVFLYVCV